ncbi:MAG: hypothetical protein DRN15_00855 [Thermoprotei archaeon]|nr:MAG: hypothetical protein DRN15_00855 [Thermoprotei archaeon]RLF25388.1 MAG: hypothetical protein DRM97_01970 [Thermoprotei archaeon]
MVSLSRLAKRISSALEWIDNGLVKAYVNAMIHMELHKELNESKALGQVVKERGIEGVEVFLELIRILEGRGIVARYGQSVVWEGSKEVLEYSNRLERTFKIVESTICEAIEQGVRYHKGDLGPLRIFIEEIMFSNTYRDAIRGLLQSLNVRNRKGVLDLCCAAGIGAIEAAMLGCDNVMGIDEDPRNIYIAYERSLRERVPPEKLRFVADSVIRVAKLVSENVNVILVVNPLAYLHGIRTLFNVAYKTISTGGLICGMLPLRTVDGNPWDPLLIALGGSRALEKIDLENRLREAGFRKIGVGEGKVVACFRAIKV